MRADSLGACVRAWQSGRADHGRSPEPESRTEVITSPLEGAIFSLNEPRLRIGQVKSKLPRPDAIRHGLWPRFDPTGSARIRGRSRTRHRDSGRRAWYNTSSRS